MYFLASSTYEHEPTRKLSYRKGDRAMRPIYGCPEKIREFLSTPTATFAEIFNGLLFRSILWRCVQNLKFVALSITEIIGALKKTGQSLDTPTLPFLPNFSWAFVQMDPVNVSAKFAVRSFTRSWDNSDCSFGLGLRTQSWGRDAVVDWGWYRSKERWWFPIGLPSNFSSIFTHFRYITTLVLQHATFYTPPLVSPKFPHVSLGVGGWPLGYE